ncbi:hypothetical protein MYX78_06090, partial [Acidobacteria bacterium AH-259-G07]|nr:hypothetical protein [Acidobacteria bacterium AH-259-G07]
SDFGGLGLVLGVVVGVFCGLVLAYVVRFCLALAKAPNKIQTEVLCSVCSYNAGLEKSGILLYMTRKSKRDSISQESLELSKVTLPILAQETASALEIVTQALGVPRDILPSDEEITHAWSELPRVLSRIPRELRTEPHVRMCVAVANGLFDAAINYSWNSAVVELRNKVRRFGIHVVPQIIIDRDFDEKALVDLKDAELLDLCLSLNLITEEGYFFLDQCRETRNNFSSAHPALGAVDDHEFLTFLNRCAKYALTSTRNPKGVDTQSFIQAIHGNKFSEEQEDEWIVRTQETHEAQRELLVGMLHGIYCDPESSEESRLNALGICQRLVEEFTPKVKSDLINRHSEYIAQGKIERQTASQAFFEKVVRFLKRQIIEWIEEHNYRPRNQRIGTLRGRTERTS